MQRFPGRMLHEIDEMDWGRHLAAFEAQNIQHVEAMRDAQIAGTVEKLDADIWERIKLHDEWIAEDGEE